jgi:4'-phosphopantetheinyl transferase
MGVYLSRQIDKNTFLGIWEINDSVEFLYNQLKLNSDEQKLYKNFRTNQRRLHWLSYRVLIKQLLNNKIRSIVYDENGKPFLNNSSHHISVTHSGKFSALIYSDRLVGIDIEHIRPKIIPISDKFMSDKEFEQVDKRYITEQLFIYWGAKEALYKLYGSRNLIFKEHIFIEGFPYKEKDIIHGKIKMPDFEKEYTLYYEYIEDYSLVYVID